MTNLVYVSDCVGRENRIDVEDAMGERGPLANLSRRQQEYLQALLEDRSFDDANRKLGIRKQHGSLLLNQLRGHGLVLKEPTVPGWVVKQYARKDAIGKHAWWTGETFGWQITVVNVPRWERADLVTHDRAVLIRAWPIDRPQDEDVMTLLRDHRARVSFLSLRLALAARMPEVSERAGTKELSTVCALLARALGTEAVLPPYMYEDKEGDAR